MSFLWRVAKFLLKWLGIATLLAAAGVIVMYFAVRNNLPDITPLETFSPLATTRLLDRSGALIGSYQDPRIRLWVPIDKVPKDVIDAVTCAEDPNFFTHEGVDFKAIWEAIKIDVQNMAYVRGASTITQQLMKNLFLSREKTLTRKMKELLLATGVEKTLDKREILEQYLNQVEWGENLYGIEAASRYYFGKPVEALKMHEGALLAGMLPNPRYFNPYARLSRLRVRQRIILKLMWQYHHISKPEYLAAVERPIVLASGTTRSYSWSSLKARMVTHPSGYRLIIEDTLDDHLGHFKLWQGGLTLYTTLDLETLKQAEKYLGRPTKIVDREFVLMKSGGTIVGIGIAPTGENQAFDKWVKERSLTPEIVKKDIPWDQILVAPPQPEENHES